MIASQEQFVSGRCFVTLVKFKRNNHDNFLWLPNVSFGSDFGFSSICKALFSDWSLVLRCVCSITVDVGVNFVQFTECFSGFSHAITLHKHLKTISINLSFYATELWFRMGQSSLKNKPWLMTRSATVSWISFELYFVLFLRTFTPHTSSSGRL